LGHVMGKSVRPQVRAVGLFAISVVVATEPTVRVAEVLERRRYRGLEVRRDHAPFFGVPSGVDEVMDIWPPRFTIAPPVTDEPELRHRACAHRIPAARTAPSASRSAIAASARARNALEN